MTKPRDNGDIEGKVIVRRWAIERLGGLEGLRVLELYGGMGVMYESVYRGCARHLAFDLRRNDHPDWRCGNNRALLPRYIGDGWDIYDADAYDNPWIIANDVCRLAPAGRFVIVATCGIRRGLKNGKSNGYVRKVIGYNGISDTRLLIRWYDDIIRWIIASWRKHGVEVKAAVRIPSAKNHLGDVQYYALDCEKKKRRSK